MVTLRVRADIPSLRCGAFLAALRASLAEANEQQQFRVVHYSVQTDHLHLIVEAHGNEALGAGMNSISARVARAVNRTFSRKGAVLAGRYHVRWLRSPREMRNAFRYVLSNVRKHYRKRFGRVPPAGVDEASSASFFDGWKHAVPPPSRAAEVAFARTWLARVGWRIHGLIGLEEVPGCHLGGVEPTPKRVGTQGRTKRRMQASKLPSAAG